MKTEEYTMWASDLALSNVRDEINVTFLNNKTVVYKHKVLLIIEIPERTGIITERQLDDYKDLIIEIDCAVMDGEEVRENNLINDVVKLKQVIFGKE